MDNLLCLRPVVLFLEDFACSSYRLSSTIFFGFWINNPFLTGDPELPAQSCQAKQFSSNIFREEESSAATAAGGEGEGSVDQVGAKEI